MRISYNWLNDYIPATILQPERMSHILTSVGLEVESLEKYEEFKGGLEGLVVGEVIECNKHPQADKLSLTTVDIGNGLLEIVCGAPNVSKGQKVVVATIGTTIYPAKGEAVTMKKAKIRGIESQGMICAQDEIGMGESHEGIIELPPETETGALLKDVLKPYSDWVFEIGLTANRMDAMSHIGVARDVSAWLSHHEKKATNLKFPSTNNFKATANTLPVEVKIENKVSCQRYTGVSISGVVVKESPEWLQKRLKSLGLRPINNIVDISNFVLHEIGQPLHVFDLDKISKRTIIVKNLPNNTPFITLDEKVRSLNVDDLMICDGNEIPMCFGGVFGGINSGVSTSTTNIFLESAWFEPSTIRRTSLRYGLRTEAAVRFEKGVDIGNTITALKRAALLICDSTGGILASEIIDVYPDPQPKKEVTLKNHYLKKISGKNYHADTVKSILQNLGFEILKEGLDDIRIAVPYNKPDVQLPADIIEEIMRIDGYDNVDIPTAITITPASESLGFEENQVERTANYLAGLGFYEIFTNSLSNSRHYNEKELQSSVRILNSLSEGLDILRPSLLETGLERIEYNINRKNNDLNLFEFGKVYATGSTGNYIESNHLALYSTGNKAVSGWQNQALKSDLYFIKGVCEQLFKFVGLSEIQFSAGHEPGSVYAQVKDHLLAQIIEVNEEHLKKFSIKQPVFFATIHWDTVLGLSKKQTIVYEEIAKFPIVQRDLSLIVDKDLMYDRVESTTSSAGINKLISMKLFDVFESDKIGVGKKSFAINFTFSDQEKTLTDKEIDAMMNRLITIFEKELDAEIRKA